MSIKELTGSEVGRITEIQKNWFVTEPTSHIRTNFTPLYTVPIGQTFGAELGINTGSIGFSGSVFIVEKIIHVFEDEVQASNFINEIGTENIASIVERYALREDLSSYKIIEVQLINRPQIGIEMELLNAKNERGFKLEIFNSSSLGLAEVEKKAIFNASGDLVSDTYLKYFEIREDE